MKLYSYLIVVFSLLTLTHQANAQSTNCATATSVPLTGTSACVNGTTVGAVTDNTLYGTCNTAPVNMVWYTFVTTGSTNSFTVTPGTLTNPEIVVYLGGCPTSGGVLQICNTGVGSAPLTTNWGIPVGTQVWIGIASNQGTQGTFQFCITSTIPPPTGGQFCSTAIPICNFNTYNQTSMAQFGSSGQTPSCFLNPTQQDMFIQFTVLTTGILAWTATDNTAGTEFDWCLYNITGGCPGVETCCNYNYAGGSPNGFGMQNIAGNQPCGTNGAAGGPGDFSPTITVTAGQTYCLQISNYNTNNAGFTLNWTNSTCVITPNAAFTITPNTIVCGPSVTVSINNTSLGGPQTWDYGDGSPNYVGTTPANHTYTIPGTYAITETIGGPCPSTATQYVNLYGPLAATATATAATCSACNGTATVSAVTGGNGSYTYSWSPAPGAGQGTPNATNMCAGTYTCTISNAACGTSITRVVTVSTTPNPVATISASANVTCNGANNGSATVSVTSGTSPFTYTWSPVPGAGQGTASASSMTPGTYTVTVNDAGGCTATATVTITQPPALTATTSQTNVNCNAACNGTATVTAAGGTGAYTYSWSPSGGTASTATSLCANTYTCHITDANGCTITKVFTITQPPAIVLTTSVVNATCGSPNGSATVTATGGTGAFTYSWTPSGGTGATTSPGLLAGTYTVLVTDANGCTNTATVTIANTGAPTLTTTSTNVSCNGGTNGAATVTATGGVTPYTFSWSPNTATTASVTNLSAGTYTVTVTGSNGCSTSATVTITQPPVLSSSISSFTNVSCFGGSNGTANVTAAGGTPNYTYSWSNGPTTANDASLAAGSYTCNITDANGCTTSSNVTITQPTQLTLNVAGIAATCFGSCNGTLICIPSGGTSSYTYSWSTGCTTASCNNICAGSYSITVTDANGCTATGNTTVNQPTAITLTTTSTAAHCGQSDGSATVTASGGTGAYTYSWNPGPPSSTSTDNNIPPATYTVTVNDANNCVATATVTVGNITGVVASIPTSTNTSCFGGTNGTATALATGGVAPYTYSWSPAPGGGQGTANATGLSAQTYTCTITDNTGCSNSATVVIGQPTQVTVTPMAGVTICIGQSTPLTASASGGTGPYTYTWATGATPVTPPVNPTTTTTYTVVATDANGCISSPAFVVITVNPPITATATGAASICPGASTTITAGGTGGNGTYSYSWSPATGLSNPNIINPSASPSSTTTYTVTVSDNCGSPVGTATVTVTVLPNPVPVITANATSGCAPLCVTFNNTSLPACVSATWLFGDGGTGTGCGSVTHCYSLPGVYSVSTTVTDAAGCVGTVTNPNYISVYSIPVAAFTASPQPTTILDPIITFTDQSTGANTWSWNFGDLSNASSTVQNPQYTYGDTGCYNVQLVAVNANGCRDTVVHPVCITPDFTFYAPNAFTPNGDGKNEVFLPEGVGIDINTYNLYIFDRWGNLIFYTDVWGKGWDGKANNGSDIAQEDVYVWKVRLNDFQGNHHAYIGHVSLIK